MGDGDYFGENALLRDDPRNATITAAATLVALKITRAKFTELGLNEKLEFKARGAVGGGAAADRAARFARRIAGAGH